MAGSVVDPETLANDLARAFVVGPVRRVTRWVNGPNSLVALFETDRGAFVAKGRDPAQRNPDALEREHKIIDHLLDKGFPTPAVRRSPAGASVVALAGHLWTLADRATGEDRYADASVFEPFASAAEVRSAGAMLARFHRALADFPDPVPSPVTGLTCRYSLAVSANLQESLDSTLLASTARDFVRGRQELSEALVLFEQLRTGLAALAPHWPQGIIHGDWIKRNLFFAGSEVSAVVDFDLACSGPLALDLALAISAAAYPWAHLGVSGANRPHAEAMLAGYESIRKLDAAEHQALPALLATCRFEFHLSLIALLLDRGQEDRAIWVWEGEVATLKWWASRTASETRLRRPEGPTAQSGSSLEIPPMTPDAVLAYLTDHLTENDDWFAGFVQGLLLADAVDTYQVERVEDWWNERREA